MEGSDVSKETENGHAGQATHLFGYLVTFAVLTTLLLVNVSLTFMEIPAPWHIVLTLVVASLQALTLLLFFMHLKQSDMLTWLSLLAGLFWSGIMFLLTLTDYLSRPYGVL